MHQEDEEEEHKKIEALHQYSSINTDINMIGIVSILVLSVLLLAAQSGWAFQGVSLVHHRGQTQARRAQTNNDGVTVTVRPITIVPSRPRAALALFSATTSLVDRHDSQETSNSTLLSTPSSTPSSSWSSSSSTDQQVLLHPPEESKPNGDDNNKKKTKTNKQAAVILNMNARGVTEAVRRVALEVFGADSVFVTTTAAQARAAARQIVAANNDNSNDSEYSLLIPIGGDGTLTATIDYLVEAIMQHQPDAMTVAQAVQQLPVIGYVPLGTGNGVGSVVGCTLNRKIRRKRPLRRLLAALKQVASSNTNGASFSSNDSDSDSLLDNTSIVELPMMQVTTHNRSDLCFFAGGKCGSVFAL